MILMSLCTKAQSMEVNGVTCSVMSDRSLFTLLAISHACPDPWSTVFLYTCTHTFIVTAVWDFCQGKYSTVVQCWNGMTNTRRETHTVHTNRHTYNIYLPTENETARGGRYLQWQGHRVKWSRIVEGCEKKWLDAIKKKRWKEKGKIIGASPWDMWQCESFATHTERKDKAKRQGFNIVQPLVYTGSKLVSWIVHKRPTRLHTCLLWLWIHINRV